MITREVLDAAWAKVTQARAGQTKTYKRLVQAEGKLDLAQSNHTEAQGKVEEAEGEYHKVWQEYTDPKPVAESGG